MTITGAVTAVGAQELLSSLGGLGAELLPRTLSAGERQLLVLARVYLGSAEVVVLDEATCHLDETTEARAEQAFRSRGCTLVVIAHRISSARRAQRVLVLDGTGVRDGSHAALVANSDTYAELVGHWST